MTRLEKYLIATASEIIEAETTVSRYFVIGNVKIRVSDHWGKNSDADLHVLIPYNGGTNYIVTIKDSPGKFLIWNAKQIKEFIPSLQIMKGLKESVNTPPKPKDSAVQKIQLALNNDSTNGNSLEFKGNIIESSLKEKNLTSNQREVLRRSKSTWNISHIGTLPRMVKMDLGLKNGSINEDVQIFLTCTSLTYVEFLNIYKIIVVDNDKVPTIRLLQEAYSLLTLNS